MRCHYQPSSELQRAAEEAARNEQRLAAWRNRRARRTNSNAQRQHSRFRLPTGPEVA